MNPEKREAGIVNCMNINNNILTDQQAILDNCLSKMMELQLIPN